MNFLSIQNLSKAYGEHPVLKHVNIDVDEGEFVVLLGPSGCGKSTLLSAIAGLDEINEGRILVDGEDVTKREPKDRSMSMVFQSYALYPTMTVRKNLEFGLKVAGIGKAEIARRVQWVADLLEIGTQLDKRPAQLSGGQRQRVAIGRALVRQSKICLFDEPLSNLDAKLRNTMRLEIRRLFKELGGTAVYVTHDQVEAMTMADRVALLRNGLIEQFDTPMEIYNHPNSIFVASFLGNPGINLSDGRFDTLTGKVTTDFGLTLATDQYSFRDKPDTDRTVVIGIRPEDMSVVDGDGENTFTASVQAVEMLGSDAIIWIQAGNLRWSMKVPASRLPNANGPIRIGVDPERLNIFCDQSEQRL